MTSSSMMDEVLDFQERRRRWFASEKIAMVAETHYTGVAVSLVAPAWGRAEPVSRGGAAAQCALPAAGAEEAMVSASDYGALQGQVRKLKRLLGKKTMEAEILNEALEIVAQKSRACARSRPAQTMAVEKGL